MIRDWQAKVDRLLELGEELASAKATLASLEKAEKSVLAVARIASEEKTQSGKDDEARLSEAYVAWREGYAVAVEQYESLRRRYEAMQIWFSMAQTEESTRREEMRLAR